MKLFVLEIKNPVINKKINDMIRPFWLNMYINGNNIKTNKIDIVNVIKVTNKYSFIESFPKVKYNIIFNRSEIILENKTTDIDDKNLENIISLFVNAVALINSLHPDLISSTKNIGILFKNNMVINIEINVLFSFKKKIAKVNTTKKESIYLFFNQYFLKKNTSFKYNPIINNQSLVIISLNLSPKLSTFLKSETFSFNTISPLSNAMTLSEIFNISSNICVVIIAVA